MSARHLLLTSETFVHASIDLPASIVYRDAVHRCVAPGLGERSDERHVRRRAPGIRPSSHSLFVLVDGGVAEAGRWGDVAEIRGVRYPSISGCATSAIIMTDIGLPLDFIVGSDCVRLFDRNL